MVVIRLQICINVFDQIPYEFAGNLRKFSENKIKNKSTTNGSHLNLPMLRNFDLIICKNSSVSLKLWIISRNGASSRWSSLITDGPAASHKVKIKCCRYSGMLQRKNKFLGWSPCKPKPPTYCWGSFNIICWIFFSIFTIAARISTSFSNMWPFCCLASIAVVLHVDSAILFNVVLKFRKELNK